MPSMTLGTRRIEYSIVKGRGRRYTYLRFREDSVLEVVAPSPSRIDAEALIREREGWVLRNLDEFSESNCVLTKDSVMFGGRHLRLVFAPTLGREELRPDLEKDLALITSSDKRNVRELVRRWFLMESSSYVVRALPPLAQELRVRYRRADVREIKNWGYCTRDGRLSFSWQLIALSERLREYVLCHELVHLSEHNHSPGFRERLSLLIPDYRQRERDLNRIIPI